MPTEKHGGHKQDNSRAAAPASSWQAAQDRLETLKSSIDEQICNTPAPIPACDAHFNHLLEERSRLAEALGKLDAIRAGKLTDDEARAALEGVLRTCEYIE